MFFNTTKHLLKFPEVMSPESMGANQRSRRLLLHITACSLSELSIPVCFNVVIAAADPTLHACGSSNFIHDFLLLCRLRTGIVCAQPLSGNCQKLCHEPQQPLQPPTPGCERASILHPKPAAACVLGANGIATMFTTSLCASKYFSTQ